MNRVSCYAYKEKNKPLLLKQIYHLTFISDVRKKINLK